VIEHHLCDYDDIHAFEVNLASLRCRQKKTRTTLDTYKKRKRGENL
jgi:hypothetical protein